MLNKVKLIGKVLSLRIKETEEKLKIYFNLEVPNPSIEVATNPNDSDPNTDVITILSCFAQGEVAGRIQTELQKDDIVEVYGYLRNEKHIKKVTEGQNEKNFFLEPVKQKVRTRQILIKVNKFVKLDVKFKEVDKKNSNQVRLIGKIITDFKTLEQKKNPELLEFKIEVPREKNPSPLFFCRIHGELINDFKQHLNKGDIIFLEGFLQSKKIEEEGETFRISAVICQGFTLLDSDSANIFTPFKGFTRIFKNIIRVIDFSKPKQAISTEE